MQNRDIQTELRQFINRFKDKSDNNDSNGYSIYEDLLITLELRSNQNQNKSQRDLSKFIKNKFLADRPEESIRNRMTKCLKYITDENLVTILDYLTEQQNIKSLDGKLIFANITNNEKQLQKIIFNNGDINDLDFDVQIDNNLINQKKKEQKDSLKNEKQLKPITKEIKKTSSENQNFQQNKQILQQPQQQLNQDDDDDNNGNQHHNYENNNQENDSFENEFLQSTQKQSQIQKTENKKQSISKNIENKNVEKMKEFIKNLCSQFSLSREVIINELDSVSWNLEDFCHLYGNDQILIKNVQWTEEEDLLLKQPEYESILIKYKGEQRTNQRKLFLGFKF